MTVALATAAWAFSAARGDRRQGYAAGPRALIALVAANAFVLFFALSWGVVVWVLLGEMFPNRIRAAALGVAAAAQWLANWLISVTFPAWRSGICPLTYAGYAVIGAAVVHLRGQMRSGRPRAASWRKWADPLSTAVVTRPRGTPRGLGVTTGDLVPGVTG